MSKASEEVPEDDRIYIQRASEMLDRRMGTLRKWEQSGDLPQALRPQRGKRGWRYWSPMQIEGIRAWIEQTDRRPGKGLKHIRENPDPVATQRQIHAMRGPRRDTQNEEIGVEE